MTDIQYKEIPLTGRWRKGFDPLLFDDADFIDATNLRPYDRGWRAVNGMTKINTTALTTYLKGRSGFHFQKEQPAESHVLVQAENTGLTASQVLQNTTAIPSAGDFSGTALMTDSSGAGKGRFSDAPQGQVCYCNSKDPPQIWAGAEQKCSAFITSTAAITNTITNPRDFTAEVQNTLQDADQVAIVGGGDDAYAKLLLHCDGADAGTTFTDNGETGHTVTAVGNAQLDTAQKKFGSASGLFDGTGDYLTVPDHADWNFGDNPFTIDLWVRFNSIAANNGLMGQYTDADNYMFMLHQYYLGIHRVQFQIVVGGEGVVSLSAVWTGLQINTWYHVAVVRGWSGNNDDWAICVDGTALDTDTSNTTTYPDFTDVLTVGAYGDTGDTPVDLNGWLDEVRISKGIARWTANFTPPSRAYSAASLYFLVGSPRPLQGCKFYIPSGGGNTESGTLTGSEWNGASWTSLTLTDNTSGLTSTGTVTWATTVNSSKPKLLNGLLLYWYQFALDTGNTDIYYCTVDMPWQQVRNLWDGMFRTPLAFRKWNAAGYIDYTLDVNTDAGVTYANGPVAVLDALTAATHWVVVGFAERMRGLSIRMFQDKVNTTAATTLAVYYWSGSAWVAVNGLVDGTEKSSISLAQSGDITWEPPGISEEFTQEIDQSSQLYFYKLVWDENLDAEVEIDRVFGIAEPEAVKPHKFSFMHQDRLFLGCEVDRDKNALTPSAYYAPDVYNGNDGGIKIYFGDDKELTAGISYYTRFGADMFYQAVVTKKNETWILDGNVFTGDDAFRIFKVSSVIGCPAPLTMAVADVGHALAPGILKQIVIWMSDIGPVAFDGNTIQQIGTDISDYWNPVKSVYINKSKLPDFVGWYDPQYNEYHLCIATGASTTLDTELVLDLETKRWFKIDRGADQDLQCAFQVRDTDGKVYTYGTIDTGYLCRLENSNAFISTGVTATFETRDAPLSGFVYNKHILSFLKIVCASKPSTPDDTIAVTVYPDSASSGTSLTAVTNEASGQRLVYDVQSGKGIEGYTHRVKCSVTTTDVAEGFEPLILAYAFKAARDPKMVV